MIEIKEGLEKTVEIEYTNENSHIKKNSCCVRFIFPDIHAVSEKDKNDFVKNINDIYNPYLELNSYKIDSNLKKDTLTKLLNKTYNEYGIINTNHFINFYFWLTDFPINILQNIINDVRPLKTFTNDYISNTFFKIIHKCSYKGCNEKVEYYPLSRTDKNMYMSNHIDDHYCENCIQKQQNDMIIEDKNRKYIEELKSMPYAEYLKTEHWQKMRFQAINKARGKCELCNSKNELHVHHKTYENKGCEKPEDLIVLCSECHALVHGKNKEEGIIKAETNTYNLPQTKVFIINPYDEKSTLDKNINDFIVKNKIKNIIDIKTNLCNNMYSAMLIFSN